MRRNRSCFTVSLAILVAGLVWGCGDDSTAPNNIIQCPFGSRTSPENVLYNLKQAYKLRSITEYESLLALKPPAFTFVLSEDDQGQPGMPDSWGRQTEIDIHACMFDVDTAQALTLQFDEGVREWDAVESMWSILVSNVNLHLYGIIAGQEEEGLQELKVEGATARFWFRKEPWTAPGVSDSVWTIVKWEDNPAGSLKMPHDPETWGEIKYLYRCP